MKGGRMLFQGKPNEVITSKSLKQLYDYDFNVIEYQNNKIVLNYYLTVKN